MNLTSKEIICELRDRVVSGKWQPGQQIETEADLANHFGVCRATINKSLKLLENEGLIWSKQGAGRFVKHKHHRKTGVIGVIVFDISLLSHPVLSRVLSGIRSQCEDSGYHMDIYVINSFGKGHDAIHEWMRKFDPSRVDGVVMCAVEVEPEIEDMHQIDRHVPVVWTAKPSNISGAGGVLLDFLGGGYQAGMHLKELGHRHVVLATLDRRCSLSQMQYDGLRLALTGLSAGDGRLDFMTADGYTVEEGRRIGKLLAGNLQDRTAVVCGSHDIALGVYESLSNAGLKIPDDISLVSWNNILTTKDIPLALTTVAVDFEKLGFLASKSLLNCIDDPDKPENGYELSTKLIIRESTAKPRDII